MLPLALPSSFLLFFFSLIEPWTSHLNVEQMKTQGKTSRTVVEVYGKGKKAQAQ
jgi:hypothetical protein